MKKILCFLGIFVILFITILPPLLRIIMPEQNISNEDNSTVVKKVLSCSSDDYIAKTQYENQDIKMIVIKKLNVLDADNPNEDSEEDNDDIIDNSKKNTAFDTFFEELKVLDNVNYTSYEDGDVILIDFSIYDYAKTNLSSVNKNITEQAIFYENYNMTCTVIE